MAVTYLIGLIVRAWGAANGVVLGQQKAGEKSNETAAIPLLLVSHSTLNSRLGVSHYILTQWVRSVEVTQLIHVFRFKHARDRVVVATLYTHTNSWLRGWRLK